MGPVLKEKTTIRNQVRYMGTKLVIPFTLFTRVLVQLHISAGHPSYSDEVKMLKKYFFEQLSGKDVDLLLKVFRKKCLHCNRWPRILKRPLDLTQLARKPREILHADYLYANSQGYILALMDSLTRKVQLTYSKSPMTLSMDQAIMSNHCLIVTDNASHFSNQLLTELSRSFSYIQSLSIAYSPWTNGSIEVINSKILHYIKTIASDYGLTDTEWPSILETINYIMNNRPMVSRNNFTADELFLEVKAQESIYQRETKYFMIALEEKNVQPINVKKLIKHAKDLHEKIINLATQTFNSVKLSTDLENMRRSKKIKLFLQF
eukprot:maker-scaffold_26-snap-gene-0.5-mRNA-1 protein AED:0.35 eAED:0.35 QI:0/0/0/1/0/0/2/0/319